MLPPLKEMFFTARTRSLESILSSDGTVSC
jgi:hypothetical protein